MLSHVKLEQIEEGKIYHRLFINGNKVRATAVNINVEVDCVPQCEVTICPENVEYNGQADVKYDFTPETVQQAVVVLRNELLKHGEFYDGFRSSVKSAVDECRTDIVTRDEMVDAIMKRIIGED